MSEDIKAAHVSGRYGVIQTLITAAQFPPFGNILNRLLMLPLATVACGHKLIKCHAQ